ncbi:MAG: efflux RND transporter periplasmic adaptor subunit [Proteobacteria bacterium]|nr:efflux RND transporter periplasmic adaptor subunit [Pseudomonadota bacterium]
MQVICRARLIATMGIIILCLMLTCCGKPKGLPQGGTPEVAVVVMKTERFPIITENPGRTSAFLVAEVRPQVSGIIQKRLFTEGSDVKADDILYQIDPATYEAAYAGAKAALARVEANVISIRNRAQRYNELVAINAVSQQECDDAVAALKQAEAEIEANKAAVETARINLAYTNVKAPISGRIGKSNVTVGALVTANQPSALAVIQQLDPIYVDATKSSVNLLQLKGHIAAGTIKGIGPGQAPAKLLLEDGKPYPLEGTLKFSDVTVDPSTGSYILRTVFPNPNHILLPGMYVRALIQEGVVDRAILVPQQGVSRDPKGNPVVLIVDAEGKVQQRIITVARAIGDRWNVPSGLAPGDRVIVEGIQKVRPGVSVKVVPFDPGPKDGAEAGKSNQTPAKAN